MAKNHGSFLQNFVLRWLAGLLTLVLAFSLAPLLGQSSSAGSSQTIQGEKIFAVQCAVCHGADARGGEYGPPLAGDSELRGQSISWLRDVIHNGIPAGGMPAFNLSAGELDALAALVRSLNLPAGENTVSGNRVAGEQYFFGTGKCASCHMVDGRGAAVGPDLSNVAREMTMAEIRTRLLQPSASVTPGYEFVTVHLRDGETLRGFARSRSNFEIALQDLNGHFHLLRENEVLAVSKEQQSPMPPVHASPQELQDLIAYLSGLTGVKPGTAETTKSSESSGVSFSRILYHGPDEWLTYNGGLSGNRYSELAKINTGNVNQLQLKWMYTVPLLEAVLS